MHIEIFFQQINCVVMKGTNEDEICDFVAFTKEKVGIRAVLFFNLIQVNHHFGQFSKGKRRLSRLNL